MRLTMLHLVFLVVVGKAILLTGCADSNAPYKLTPPDDVDWEEIERRNAEAMGVDRSVPKSER